MSDSYIFKNQTKLRFRLSTFLDLTTAASATINYTKPSGSSGTWTALFESPRIGGVIYYDIETSDQINETGTWLIWGKITYNDGKIAPTTAVRVVCYPEGTVV